MRRLLATCLIGLVSAMPGCSLDLGSDGQTNDTMEMPDDDLPGDEYRQCVLDTLQDCDVQDLTPNQCTDLIALNCNDSNCEPGPDGMCPPCDPTTDPMGCPPPGDCFQTVFDECVAGGGDPMACAWYADQVCNPQCDPMDPMCPPPCDWNDPTCPPPCDPMTGENCGCTMGDPNCCVPQPDGTCCDPTTHMCEPPPCIPQPDGTCCDPATNMCEPPPPCDPMTDPTCCVPGPDGTCCTMGDPNCPPPCDPADPMCCDPSTGMCPPPPPPCDPMTDPTCCVPHRRLTAPGACVASPSPGPACIP
jgi:hypothetical protein